MAIIGILSKSVSTFFLMLSGHCLFLLTQKNKIAMTAKEKKILEALSQGEFENIKATDELIETLIDTARETIEKNEAAIKDEEAKGEKKRQAFIDKLEAQNDVLQKVIDNGETYLENVEKSETLFSLYEEE